MLSSCPIGDSGRVLAGQEGCRLFPSRPNSLGQACVGGRRARSAQCSSRGPRDTLQCPGQGHRTAARRAPAPPAPPLMGRGATPFPSTTRTSASSRPPRPRPPAPHHDVVHSFISPPQPHSSGEVISRRSARRTVESGEALPGLALPLGPGGPQRSA